MVRGPGQRDRPRWTVAGGRGVHHVGRLGRMVRPRRPSRGRGMEGNGSHPGYHGSQFRYGPRVGCLVLGPYAKNAYISKVFHSHVSLLKFCEVNFGLSTLNERDAGADDMADCFDFGKAPAPPPPVVP